MPLSARIFAPLLGAFALAAVGCATVPDGAVQASALRCPEDSDCYDPPIALGEGGEFAVVATEFAFSEPEGLWWAGNIEVTLRNEGAAEHDFVVTGANEGTDEIIAFGGTEDTGIVNLFEGEYVFYCSIPGHRAQGMEGTLNVLPTQDEAEAAG